MIAAIQSLEPRMLMSAVTSTTLITDKANLLADAAALKTDLKLLFTGDAVLTKEIKAAFKVLPKADQPLLKTLTTDASKGASFLTKNLNALINPGSAAVKKAESVGISLLKKATVKLLANESTDITALGTAISAPFAALQTLLSGTKLTADRNAILAAVPEDTALIVAVTTQETNATAAKATLVTAAAKFATDIETLAVDLTSVHTAVGTFPHLTGTLNGNATILKGKHAGQSAQISMVIQSEDANGNLSGTISDLSTGGVDSLKGTISLNSVFAAKAKGSNGTITILGQFSNGTLVGTFKDSKNGGSFTVTKTP